MNAVFLVGFMGAGKSTVGRGVAAVLGWPFFDTDDRVEQDRGRSIAEIFRDSGEGRFREWEWQALQSLAGDERVVATGGGLFVGLTQRRWMARRGVTVWLDAPLEACRSRAAETARERPLWARRSPLELRVLYEKRRAVYALAQVRVDAAGPPREVTARVVDAIGAFFH